MLATSGDAFRKGEDSGGSARLPGPHEVSTSLDEHYHIRRKKDNARSFRDNSVDEGNLAPPYIPQILGNTAFQVVQGCIISRMTIGDKEHPDRGGR